MRTSSRFGVLPLVFGFLGAVVLQGCASTSSTIAPRAVALNHDGAAAFAVGDLGTAATRFQLALEYNDRFPEAWVNLGLVELRRGNLDAADRDLEKARELNANLPTPHHGLALVAEARGKTRDAENDYRAALAVDPGFPAARVNLARLLEKRGAYDDAREQYARLVEVAPERLEGWLGLVESLVQLGRDDESERTLESARERFGDIATVRAYRARQQMRHQAFADAEETLTPVLASEDAPERVMALGWIALARVGEGHFLEAKRAAADAIAIDADDMIANYAMASALYIEGDDASAAVWFKRADRSAPGSDLPQIMSRALARLR